MLSNPTNKPWVSVKVQHYDVKIDKCDMHFFEEYSISVHQDKRSNNYLTVIADVHGKKKKLSHLVLKIDTIESGQKEIKKQEFQVHWCSLFINNEKVLC